MLSVFKIDSQAWRVTDVRGTIPILNHWGKAYWIYIEILYSQSQGYHQENESQCKAA